MDRPGGVDVTPEDKSDVQKKLILELIEFGFMLTFVVIVQYLHDDSVRERTRMRLQRIFRPETVDPLAAEVRNFSQRISDWEHEEMEG